MMEKCLFIDDPHHGVWSQLGITSEGPVWEMSCREAFVEKIMQESSHKEAHRG